MISLFKKEINSFLSSAIGYVSIIVFLLATGTFMWVFNGTSNVFDMGQSSMNSFFVNAPKVFLFLTNDGITTIFFYPIVILTYFFFKIHNAHP